LPFATYDFSIARGVEMERGEDHAATALGLALTQASRYAAFEMTWIVERSYPI